MDGRNYYKLNEGEKLIGSSDEAGIVFDRGGFVLTNQRVIKVDRTPFGGESRVHSINLENLDSIVTTAIQHLGFILVAVGCLLLLTVNEKAPAIAIGGFAICLIAFFLTRSKVIRLVSGNSVMDIVVSWMAHQQIQEMVFEIEQAKQRRLERLQKGRILVSTPDNVRARLLELKALLDDGVITQLEWEERGETDSRSTLAVFRREQRRSRPAAAAGQSSPISSTMRRISSPVVSIRPGLVNSS